VRNPTQNNWQAFV